MKTTNTPLKNAAAAMGRKGGKAGTGKAKARTSDQARKAALVRWSKPRPGKEAGK